jgi:SAM-dependent methyltransferase
MTDYQSINRKLWNDKTGVHLESEFYDLPGFKAGKSSLNDIELEQLGDIRGKKLLHLQCHFGQDTLSLARKGAEVTGVDLSDKAIEAAQGLAEELEIPARFVTGDVLEADLLLEGEQFDIIFSSYGTIGWLPEIKTWGRVIYNLLRPGGVFHFVEFHPFIWLFDEQFGKIVYPYFNRGPIIEEIEGSYADRDAPIKNESCSWAHSLADVFTALREPGLDIVSFREFDYSPYDCFPKAVKTERGYQVKGMEGMIPMVFALEAVKR